MSRKRRKDAKHKTKKLLNDDNLYEFVENSIKDCWSPERIAGRARIEQGLIICHETIYDFIYEEKKEWKIYFRQKKGKYRRRHGTKKREKERIEMQKRRIDARPPIVNSRERIGDWEGDTIMGGEKTTGIITHVERKSGYLLGVCFSEKAHRRSRKKQL